MEVASNGIARFLLPPFPSPPAFPHLPYNPISFLMLHLLFSGSFLAEQSFRKTLFVSPQVRVISSSPIQACACPHPSFSWRHLVLGQTPLEWLHQEGRIHPSFQQDGGAEMFYLGCPAQSCCASGPTCALHPALGMQHFPHCSPTSLCSSLALKQPQPVRRGVWRAIKSCFLCREKESPGSLRDQALCTDLQM